MAQPPSLLPSSQPAFSGIDAAVAAIIENSTSSSSDIIGTAVSLSTVTMDRIETMMQKLRTRGKKLPKSKLPLTVDRPYARADSPPPKTAISPVHGTAREISPEPRTAFSASPPSSSSRFRSTIPKVNLPSTKTGKEVTPRPSEVYQRLVPAPADPSIRTGRGVSPTPRSSGYPTALEPGTPPNPASRRQSISDVRIPSTRTGREITPRSSNADLAPQRSVHTGRGVSPTPRSSGYPTAISPGPTPPGSRRQSIQKIPSLKTGREATPRNSNADLARSDAASFHHGISKNWLARHAVRTGRGVSPAPRSSGYSTAKSPATPPNPASRRQSISNVLIPSTRTGREITPRNSNADLGRSDPAVLTGRGVSPTPRSSGYPTALEPETAQKKFVRPCVTGDASDKSTRTGREASPTPRQTPPAVQSNVHVPANLSEREKPLTPAEQWANVKPNAGPKIVPAGSPVLSTARENKPQSQKSKREIQSQPETNEIWKDLLNAAEKQKAPTGSGASKRDDSVRTGRGLSPSPRSSDIATEEIWKDLLKSRGVSPTPRSSGYPTALEPATALPPASRRQSISNVRIPSTRTGREITPRNSDAAMPTQRSDASIRTGRGVSPTPRSSGLGAANPPRPASQRQSISNVHLPSTRTGREITPRNSNADLAPQRSNFSTRTGRGVSPTPRSSGYPTAISPGPTPPGSRRQSIQKIPYLKTGREATPRNSNADLARSDAASFHHGISKNWLARHAVRTGRGVSPAPRSSEYPTALEPATALSPASRRQSISNVHIPSTRTGRETTPPHSFRTAVADDVLDKSTRTGREASHRLPVTADPQLITRTTVVPVNQNGEGGPPGVMLFVHSFYVFSMTLDAWANHLSNQNPAQNVTQNPAQ